MVTTEIKYAPVIIPTLCRAEHFIRCIESLRKNTWAEYTDVYIALDYPAKDSHWDGYNKICEYLQNEFTEFNEFHVVKRPCNYGAGKNIKELKEIVLEKYDRYIRTDDDVEFAPNFLEYMDKCLSYFEDDENVIAVTGYSYPVDWEVSEGSTVFKENFIVPMWGTGFWKDKIKIIENQIKNACLVQDFNSINKSGAINRMTKACYVDYINMSLRNNADNGLMCRMTDVSMRAFTSIYDKYVVAPVLSKVRNWGFDGSGMYCGKIDSCDGNYAYNYSYKTQRIDTSRDFDFILDEKNANDENRKRLDGFDVRSRSRMFKAKLQHYLYCLLGKRIFLGILRTVGK